MIRSGKCPGCESVPYSIFVETSEGPIGFMGQSSVKLVSFVCSGCRTILGVQVDPLAVKTDTVNELKKALGR